MNITNVVETEGGGTEKTTMEESKAVPAKKKKNYRALKNEEKMARARGCVRVFTIGQDPGTSKLVKGYYNVPQTELDQYHKGRMNKVTTVSYDDFNRDIYLGSQEGVIMKWKADI